MSVMGSPGDRAVTFCPSPYNGLGVPFVGTDEAAGAESALEVVEPGSVGIPGVGTGVGDGTTVGAVPWGTGVDWTGAEGDGSL